MARRRVDWEPAVDLELREIGKWRLRREAQRRSAVPSPGHGSRPPGHRVPHRTAAVVLLAAFAAFLAAPLVHADEAEGRYCAGDRCCCSPDLDEAETCFRSVCRCGTAAREAVVVALGEVILPVLVQAFLVETARSHVCPPAPLPTSPPLSPPDHPPPAV